MIIGNGQFLLGDCLDLLASVPDGSVDMILCDLPYGTTACKWDQVIPFAPLWAHYWRVCKPNAAVVLTASQPFTSALVMSQIDRFKYCWVWDKRRATGGQFATKQPMRAYEDICIFGGTNYYPIMVDLTEAEISRKHKTDIIRPNSEIVGKGSNTIKGRYDGRKKYPTNVLRINGLTGTDKERCGHPTQKPVTLFDYLIRTYTNPGDLVLDNCAGSGTTAVAAQASGRRWLCMERDPSYYYAAVGRVWSS